MPDPTTPDLAGLSSSAVSDAAGQIWSPQATSSASTSRLTCVVPGGLAAGPAYTIRIGPARRPDPESRTRLFQAYQDAPAGSVVVIQVIGEVGGAVMGDVVAHLLQLGGVAGLVVDGQVRDAAALRAMGFPVWSREITMRAIRTKELVTEVGVPVSCDGVPVHPQDVVVADDDGVFVLPSAESGPIVALARQIVAEEVVSHRQLSAGSPILAAYHPAPAPASAPAKA